MFCQLVLLLYICSPIVLFQAEVAHLVEHDLAKVGVAGSSPVFRSEILPPNGRFFLDPWWWNWYPEASGTQVKS